MSKIYSPRIVTDSLVMCLDASQNKSYPTDLPVKNGLVMWMDAADDTTFSYSSGTTVTQWRDKSGFNYHMVPKSSGPTRNAFLNSRKALAFTAAQTIGNNTMNLASSANTVFVVSRLTGVTNGRVLTCNLDASGNNWLLGHHGGTYNDYYAEGWVSDGGALDSNWRMYMGDWSGTSTDLANLYSNGTAITTNSTAASQGPKYLGVNYYSNEVSTCEVAEIIVFNRVLSTVERRLVHTYLGQKWGISNTDRSIIDLSTNNYSALLGNGTTANMPLFDVYNKGTLKFDGSNDYITTGVSSIVPTSTAAYTVSVWCYRNTNNSSYKELLAQWTNANSGNSFYFGFENSNVRFTDNWQPVTVSGAGNTNVWMNLVGVYTVSNAYIYLNGVLAATKGSGFTYTGTGPFVIGRQGELNAEYFDGNIGNILVYQKALSAVEVLQNYEAQKSKFANTIVQQGLVLNLDAGNPYSYAGAGTTWYDVSGNSNNGTLTNGPVYNTTNGGIIVFDGSNDYVDLTGVTLSLSGNAARSMFAWVKTTYNGNQAFIATGTPAGSQAFILVKYGSYVGVMGYNNDFYPSSGKAIADGVWHYVGATFDGTNLRTYVDGVLDNTSGTINYTTTGQNNYVGRSNHAGNENFINGSMGNSQIYNRTLSATEVLQNYNATKGRFGL